MYRYRLKFDNLRLWYRYRTEVQCHSIAGRSICAPSVCGVCLKCASVRSWAPSTKEISSLHPHAWSRSTRRTLAGRRRGSALGSGDSSLPRSAACPWLSPTSRERRGRLSPTRVCALRTDHHCCQLVCRASSREIPNGDLWTARRSVALVIFLRNLPDNLLTRQLTSALSQFLRTGDFLAEPEIAYEYGTLYSRGNLATTPVINANQADGHCPPRLHSIHI